MARATPQLVDALRRTALRLTTGADYKWSHFGQCNCGHLAQTVTHYSSGQLQAAAQQGAGDWGEQAREFCPSSGYPLDLVFETLFSMGVAPADVQRLERLNDGRVLKFLGVQGLQHNRRDEVVRYLRGWADLLESELAADATALAAE